MHGLPIKCGSEVASSWLYEFNLGNSSNQDTYDPETLAIHALSGFSANI